MIDDIVIRRDALLTAYQNSDNSGKELLKNLFKDIDLFQSIPERIKSVEDACRYLKIDPETHIAKVPDKSVVAYSKLVPVIKAYNEGWEPDWNNDEEYKWYIWIYMDQPGFRLDYVHCYYSDSYAGSRLCFRTRELAETAIAQPWIFDLYKDFFTV